MKKTLILLAIFTSIVATAQSVGINADGSAANASAMLDVSSTTKGFLPPRMTTTERDLIASPATGLVLFNTTTNGLEIKSCTGWTSLTTPSTKAVFLPTIVIGTQQWMEKNLDVVTYRNGDIIPQVTDATAWAGLTTGAWCYYNNDLENGAIYGKLYNWFAVNDSRGLAPKGWHVATDVEWTILTDKLGGASVAGGKMKSVGTTRWTTSDTSATNESGFTGLPGGSRNYSGTFNGVGNYGFWWSSAQNGTTYAWYRVLVYSNGGASLSYDYKKDGFSVRCLRD